MGEAGVDRRKPHPVPTQCQCRAAALPACIWPGHQRQLCRPSVDTQGCDAHERVVHATANLPLRAFAGCHTSDAVSPIAGRKGAASTTPTITAGLVVVRELRAKHGGPNGNRNRSRSDDPRKSPRRRGGAVGRLVVGNCAPDCALTDVYSRQTPSLTGKHGETRSRS
jgi:hypothetical protein